MGLSDIRRPVGAAILRFAIALLMYAVAYWLPIVAGIGVLIVLCIAGAIHLADLGGGLIERMLGLNADSRADD